jgi:hypothetical protein
MGQVEPGTKEEQAGGDGNNYNSIHSSIRFKSPRMKQTPTKPTAKKILRSLGKEGMVFMALSSRV